MNAPPCLSREEEKNAQALFKAAEDRRRPLMGDPNGDWATVKRGYNEVVRYLNITCQQQRRDLWELPIDAKLNIVNSLIWMCYCDLQIRNTSSPEMLFYDDPRNIAKILDRLELDIRRYELGKPEVYNLLQCRYDEWCEQFRAQGKKYEADELQYYMLRARMKWSLSNLLPFIPKMAQWWERGFVRLRKDFHAPLRFWGKAWEKFNILSDAVRAWFEWALYSVGKSLILPFFYLVIVPILVFACIYKVHGCVGLELADGAFKNLPGFGPSLVYSILVFTGSEAGPLTMCPDNEKIFGAMALESLFAYVFAIVVIGYLVNRLSNR
jgi:hypothetical protein